MPSSISEVMTFTRGNFLQTMWMPSGAAMRLRNKILPSSTPFDSTTCTCSLVRLLQALAAQLASISDLVQRILIQHLVYLSDCFEIILHIWTEVDADPHCIGPAVTWESVTASIRPSRCNQSRTGMLVLCGIFYTRKKGRGMRHSPVGLTWMALTAELPVARMGSMRSTCRSAMSAGSFS